MGILIAKKDAERIQKKSIVSFIDCKIMQGKYSFEISNNLLLVEEVLKEYEDNGWKYKVEQKENYTFVELI